MKKSILSLFGLSLLFAGSLQAQQVHDSVSINPGYTHQAFYSLENGLVSTEDNNNWELAFDVSGFGSSIRINGQSGMKLYSYPNGDTASWASVDTTGMGGWSELYDSDTEWLVGAFDGSANSGNPSDLGWGMYNQITHQVVGDSLYVVQMPGGSFKKLWIERLASGVYTFRHANLDGTNDVTETVDKSPYSGKNFVYFSLSNNNVIDREPMSADWDLTFTRYVGLLPQGVYYGVSGVLSNAGWTVAEASGVDVNNVDHTTQTFESDMNVIGYDWKSFQGMWVIQDSLTYFLQDQAGNIWQITFTDFGGSSTGKFYFTKEKIISVGIGEQLPAGALRLYPNPSEGMVNLSTEISGNWEVNVFDVSGKVQAQERFVNQGFVNHQMNLSHLPAGLYFVNVRSEAGQTTSKLILK